MSASTGREVVIQEAVEAFESLPDPSAGTLWWRPRNYVCMRLVCMRTAGIEDVDYETLMTVSGFGTGFAYEPREKFWAHCVAPEGAHDRIAHATGFAWESLNLETPQDYWEALRETIDSGRPVHAPYLEEILLVGYRDADRTEDRAVRVLVTEAEESGPWWPWGRFRKWFASYSNGVLGRQAGPMDRDTPDEVAYETLGNIVQLAVNDPRARRGYLSGVRWGLAGLRAYADDVGDVRRSGAPDVYFERGWLGGRNVYPQFTGRRCAATWLERLARSEGLPGGAREHLVMAAHAYDEAYAAWLGWEKLLGRREISGEDCWLDPERRRAGAADLLRAIDLERAALEHAGLALAAIEDAG